MLSTHFFIPPGAAEREEQYDCPVGPEQQAPLSAGRREEEFKPEPQTYPGTAR